MFVYALIYVFIYLCTYLKERKASLSHIYYFMSEVINVDFWQIWDFDVKGTGWVSLELSIIFEQTVGKFDM